MRQIYATCEVHYDIHSEVVGHVLGAAAHDTNNNILQQDVRAAAAIPHHFVQPRFF